MVVKPHIMELFSLKGKVALVTGGCQNLGLDAAVALGQAGATLVITSRNEEKARETAQQLEKNIGVEVLGIKLEVTGEQSVRDVFQQVADRYHRLDILVNNAGGHPPGSTGRVEDEPVSAWKGFLEVNLTGTFLCLREAAKIMMKQRSGSIINIASVTSLVGRDRSVYAGTEMKNPIGYTASKAGVLGLTYDAAAYLGQYGIRVNAISPGGFQRGQPESFIRAYSEKTMLGRMGRDGYDLKGAIVFLASEASAYVTGHNLVVDGGFTRFK
ncbi:MAG TPA: SDR family oxidoreductase [bacterium]|nr:SDR family oxidoreductase [bacterium]HOL67363.1 SDR family oxidoreductase [bacterium]